MNLGQETEELEFKKSTGEIKEGMISLASMLNKNGAGTVYFGVRNDGEVIGQQIGDRTLRDISQNIATAVKPQVIPTIIMELCDDKNVIKVTAQGDEKPYSAYGKYYMRSADEDREISPSQLKNLMMSVSGAIVNMESNNQALTFEQLKTLYAGNHLTLHEDTYRQNLNLLTRSGTFNLMAYILADANSFSIKVAAFAGTDKTKLIRRNEYGYKCMLVAVKQVLDYVEALNETAVDFDGGLRREHKKFDFPSFREAWLNACLHNRWSRMTPPAVYIFSDRIEILSVGGLPEGLSLDEFFAGKSKPVNLELQQIMVQLDYVEQTGHGVPLIVSKYGKEAFDITENFITVTIPFDRETDRIPVSDGTGFHESNLRGEDTILLDETDRRILELMRQKSTITVSEIGSRIGRGATTVTKHIRKMREQGMITRVGSKKSGKWQVSYCPQRPEEKGC